MRNTLKEEELSVGHISFAHERVNVQSIDYGEFQNILFLYSL